MILNIVKLASTLALLTVATVLAGFARMGRDGSARLFAKWHFATGLFVAFLFTACPLAAAGSTGPNPAARESVRVVMDDNYPPYIFRDSAGTLKGILVDQWALWEQKTGIHVRLEAMDWAKAQQHMEAGDYDVIDTIFVNEHRKALYDFSAPYARIDVPLFFSRELSGIQGPKDLEGFVVGAKRGDNSIEILKASGVTNFLLFDNYEAIVAAARDDKIKVFTIDKPPALYFLIKMGIQDQFRESKPLYTGQFHRAVRKGNTGLLEVTQQGFDAISKDEYEGIERRWYGAPLFTKEKLTNIAVIAGGAGGIVCLLLLWVWLLRRSVRQRTAELRADIIERKLAEEALRVSEQKLTKIFQMSPDAIDLASTTDRVSLDFNHAFTKLFGYTPEDFIGQPALPMGLDLWVDMKDRDRLMTCLKEHGQVLGFEAPHRRKDGSVFIAEISSSSLEIDGKLCHLSITRDITERKALQDELEKSRNLLQQVLDSLPIPLYCKDQDQRYSLCNRTFQKFMGLSEQDLIGKTSFDISAPPLGELYRQSDHQLLEAGDSLQYETVVQAASGLRQIVVTKNVMRNSTGELIGLVGAFLDITERKQAEEDRRKLDARMSQIQKLEALGILVAGVAHNMNNVLAVIMGIASVREELATESKDLEAYKIIGKACSRGKDVVKSLMKFARPSLSDESPLEIHALLTEVRVLLANTTRNRIEIVEAFTADPLWIRGDAGNLNQAVMNLCINALDAMPDGGILTLRTAVPEKDLVEVSVEDTGEGMTPEILNHVLEPFFTTKELGKGTGLGLSMTHGVIKAHGGTMELSSTPGRGTTVKLRFPMIPAPGPAQAVAVPKPSLGQLKVLLVDDDGDIRNMATWMLNKAGCREIEAVAGGEEALNSLRSGSIPDLIILDQNMPNMDGIQTMERIRALPSDVPILISSGQPDIEEWACFKQPNVAVLPKPFEMDELLAKLAQFPRKSSGPSPSQ